jgi:hypothetical protein
MKKTLAVFSLIACALIARTQTQPQIAKQHQMESFTIKDVLWTTEIKTNVIEGSNAEGCGACRGIYLNGWAVMHDRSYPGHDGRAWKEANERWSITNEVQVNTLTFRWLGKERTVVDEFLLTSVTNRQVLQHEWVTK